MAATAKLMAFLGMNPSGFNSGVGQASKSASSFQVRIASMHKMMMFAFGSQIISKITAAASRIDELQQKEGIKIVSDQELERLKQTSLQLAILRAEIEAIGVKAAGPIAQGLSGMIAFFKTLLSGGGLNEAVEARDKAAFGQSDRRDPSKAKEAIVAAERAYDAVLRSTFSNAEKIVDLENERNDLIKEREKLTSQVDPDAVTGMQLKEKELQIATKTAEIIILRGKAEKELADSIKTITDSTAKADKETSDIRQNSAFALMTVDEKRLKLAEQIKEIEGQKAALLASAAPAGDKLAQAKKDLAVAELNKQQARLDADLATMQDDPIAAAATARNAAPVDSLRQIGVIGGTAGPSPADLQRKLLVEAQKQGKYSAEMVRLLREKKGGVF